ncbi:hypothetical protein ACV229_24185 [Burkholderia sp. MR1-5-21]
MKNQEGETNESREWRQRMSNRASWMLWLPTIRDVRCFVKEMLEQAGPNGLPPGFFCRLVMEVVPRQHDARRRRAVTRGAAGGLLREADDQPIARIAWRNS